MNDVYIIDYLRSPFGRYNGILAETRIDDLLSQLIKQMTSNWPENMSKSIDDVIIGCVNQAGEDNRNLARFAALLAGLPVEVPGVTVNRLCASGMQSIIDAYSRIACGMDHIILAGGAENMTRAPFVMLKNAKPYAREINIEDSTLGWRFTNPRYLQKFNQLTMGETAELIAEKWEISRDEQDEYAYSSHKKYFEAWNHGRYSDEITPVSINEITVDIDENARQNTSVEKLKQLQPTFKLNGTVTAGNASGINDGAAIMLIASSDIVKKYKLNPLAKIVSASVTGVHPDFMGTGPIPATRKLLNNTGLALENIDLFEINEAFAVQVIHCMKELNINPQIVNVNGGALAIGHPLGASGTRITGSLAKELRRRNKKYGIATMCVGVGQGTSILIENINI